MSSVMSLTKMLASLLLLATPALAVDGEILIDQARVNAGGITPGDAPGFPATLSRPGRYKLAGNLTVPAGKNGIEVKQHSVVIDLNGFSISSNPPGEALTAVDARVIRGLRVTNGTITGFEQYAILNADGDSAVVENTRIVNNRNGVVLGNNSRMRNSTMANGDFGIECLGRCLIEQNIVTGIGGYGIAIYGKGTVLGNLIVSNDSPLFANEQWSGYGNNVLFGNGPIIGFAAQLHPNLCVPTCP